MRDDLLSIGDLARRAGRRASSIRYYEEIGLLPEPPRRGGQRRYGQDTVRRLAVIQAAQRAGLTLSQIKSLLDAAAIADVVAADGTIGDHAARHGTAGHGTYGGGTARHGTAGGGTAGHATAGHATSGHATSGGGTSGGGTAISLLRAIAAANLTELAAQMEQAEQRKRWLEAAASCECPSIDDCALFSHAC